ENERGEVWAEDEDVLYERMYLMIQSRIGRFLDSIGLHRVHGLGFSYKEKAYLFLMPSGGGKSTLALGLLEQDDIKIFSVDTPLIDWRAQMSAFPLRISVKFGEIPKYIPIKETRVFQREGRPGKTVISMSVFSEKVEKRSARIKTILVGKWTAASEPS